MSDKSPNHRRTGTRVLVVDIGAISDAAGVTDLGAAIDAIRAGGSETGRAGVGSERRSPVITLASDSSALRTGVKACAEVRGRACTDDEDEDASSDIRPLQPARAIRRALADGAMKAAELDSVWAVFDARAHPDARRRAAAAISLALGRHAARVAVDLRPTFGDGRVSAVLCVARAISAIAQGRVRAAVCVSIGVDGTNTALALSATR